ncbi:hypothetical protein LDENG_00254400 [Lucifuga dentata]|nr:hypothetical protein LDENG_00254400 [Lucifuga dentata]
MDMPANSLKVGYKEEDGTMFFESYIPPAWDDIHLPTYVLYLLMAVFILLLVLYAIIGHLIKDLIHDFADWLFGEQPEEVMVNLCEAKDKFMADWCPETTPELQEMARAEECKMASKNNTNSPAIWIISDGEEPRPARMGPCVMFGRADALVYNFHPNTTPLPSASSTSANPGSCSSSIVKRVMTGFVTPVSAILFSITPLHQASICAELPHVPVQPGQNEETSSYTIRLVLNVQPDTCRKQEWFSFSHFENTMIGFFPQALSTSFMVA